MIAYKSISRIGVLGFKIAGCILLSAIASNALADQVTLQWDANTESDLAGYRIHQGNEDGSYSVHIDVHNVTTYTMTGLTEGQTYYFAATAYDASGNESGYSNQVSYTVPQQGRLLLTPFGGLTSSGNQGGPFSPSSITYTLTNPDTRAINWTASKNQNWLTLSSTNGTLQPSGSTNVTVSINSNANILSPSSTPYRDTVTFTNTTNGQGGGGFGVILRVNKPGSIPNSTNSMFWLQLLLE